MAKAAKKKPAAKAAVKTDAEIDAERIEAYFNLEQPISAAAKMGTIASLCAANGKREACEFAVYQLAEMLQELKTLYFSRGFRNP